jgi:prepilin-type N-terminal cleavage/methylation domain-containing protein
MQERSEMSSERSAKSDQRSTARRGGFTLTELLVAIAVLVVVILATGRIFGTVTKVTNTSHATADVLTEAAAIEAQIRADIQRLSYEGAFGIRNVRVRNDINSGALLDPTLPADSFVRCDQLVFFANGVHSLSGFSFAGPQGTNSRPQGGVARVYYGHAVQINTASSVDPYNGVFNSGAPLQPWSSETELDLVDYEPGLAVHTTNAGMLQIVAPKAASSWLLARQAVILGDDPGFAHIYLDESNSATAMWEVLGGEVIPHRALTNSRVDVCASQLNDIRRVIQLADPATNDFRPWAEQRDLISRLILGRHGTGGLTPPLSSPVYPRATRLAESTSRVDQAQTTTVISSACSSFMVEWTYEDGAGEVVRYNASGGTTRIFGISVLPYVEQPWFGLYDATRAVAPLGTLTANQPYQWGRKFGVSSPYNGVPPSINPIAIEGPINSSPPPLVAPFGPQPTGPVYSPAGQPDVQMYEAIFGFNQTDPTLVDETGAATYTPWPTALRITMTLHDPKSRLEQGRVFQFVVKLPTRSR